ncbi:putative enzyme of poly-gamma-glutamate biosynthesis (capsule formation) [Salinarchaeum sp. Harcht-Bsk1]|uniref:CapA family protein n=1 Tax=Salinarchaeum sp. Harcht-Bsk1 TaxID=1333523 RepID=UPI0003423B69|nr:CapA family protein [Salinarchaeum sp. Harcht-Bsk1]AGN01687.1 putative enzyme of poly-gamma-glutamate biosynthesis (capsule formation) [Salinarchaeum sp. Harcht-Bsk1]
MALRLGLTGDVMLGRLVDEAQQDRPPTAVWGDVLSQLRDLDGLLLNLECCLSTRGTKWRRTRRAFHFRADPDWAIPALEAAGTSYCSLANNHVLDFEEPALFDTLDHLDEAGIPHAGAGRTEQEAFAPATFEIGTADEVAEEGTEPEAPEPLSVAVVSLTDNTPEYAATATSPGTAHVEIDVDDAETRAAVESAIERANAADPDLLVASLHWGPNMVAEPPERFRRFAHWLVEQGVDLLHGHSAHVVQGIEIYEGVPILYDCGDFVDDYAVNQTLRNDRSFLFEARVDVEDRSITALHLTPTEIENRAVRVASPATAQWLRETIRDRSDGLGTSFVRHGEGLVVPVNE